MATERLTMQKLREILRQKLELKRSHRDVARALMISAGAVGTAMTRANALGAYSEGFDQPFRRDPIAVPKDPISGVGAERRAGRGQGTG
jgi:hypothetical protein